MKKIAALLCTLALLAGCAVRAGGQARAEEQEFIFGTTAYPSAISGSVTEDSFWFSDEWFSRSPEEGSEGLAMMSARLSVASDGTNDAALLKALGFSDAEGFRFDSGDPKDCAYVTGTKTVVTDSGTRTVRAVVFQGREYGKKGWLQNMTVNPEEGVSADHAAFAAAARIFLEDYERMPREDGTLLWICGMSRGGAVANIVSAYLLEREDPPELVCYTFESPATTQRENAHDGMYRCIRNYISDDDPVTMIPMWGMTRYGEDVRINNETKEELLAVLTMTSADAAAYIQAADPEALGSDVRTFLASLAEKLTLTIPERQDYSAVNTAVLPDGETISYTFQDSLKAICGILFSGAGLNADSLSGLSAALPDIVWPYLAEAWEAGNNPGDGGDLLREAAQARWNAAGACAELFPEEIRAEIRREDLYALLRLIAPLLVNHDMIAEGWELPEKETLPDTGFIKLSDLLAVGMNSSLLVRSHQPEVIIARMTLRAPAPVFPECTLQISGPAAGDSTDAAPAEIMAQAGDFPETWLKVTEAAWISAAEGVLPDGRIHTLKVAVSVAGHRIPDDFRFRVNGAEPAEQIIRYKDGTAVIEGVWTFRVGEPAQAAVRFDMDGHGDAPEPFAVESGMILRYARQQLPDPGTVRDEQGIWRFEGWTDADGNDWRETAAVEDVTLHSSWTRMIDGIDLSFAIPRRGETVAEPEQLITMPDHLPLMLSGVHIYDENWEEVQTIGDRDEYCMMLSMVAGEGGCFLTETAEDGELFYAGSLTVNGQPPDLAGLYRSVEDGVETWEISCEYTFRPAEP